MRKFTRPSASLIVSSLALFVALGGTSLAASGLIGTSQIKNGAITTSKIHSGAVTASSRTSARQTERPRSTQPTV